MFTLSYVGVNTKREEFKVAAMFKKIKEWWESKKAQHTVTVVVEFQPVKQSEVKIGDLSMYIASLVRKNETILTDVQSIPAGYRATFVIRYKTSLFSNHRYDKELSRLSDWLHSDRDCNGCLSRYHYSCT